MNKKLMGLLLALTLSMPFMANATLLTDIVDSTTTTCTDTTISTEVLALFAALADDIGEMADRILEMADKIGEMADRIVATEQLMADMVVELAQINASIAELNGTSAPTVLITSDVLTINTGVAPTFTISTTTPEYVVYVSSTLVMGTNTTSIIVHNNDELQAQWAQLETLSTDGNIYIAVKTIDANTISSLSNVLTFNIL